MKKIFFAVILMIFLPVLVQAEECTQEMLNSYLPLVEQAEVSFKQLGTSTTYEVWATKVPTGITLDNGRTASSNNEFLGYVSAGQVLNIKVFVSDGSVCASKTIKTLSVTTPKVTNPIQPENQTPTVEGPSNNNDDSNNSSTKPDTTPPKVNQNNNGSNIVEKPSENDLPTSNETSTNNGEHTNNDISDNPINNEEQTEEETITDEKVNLETKDNKYIYKIISISSIIIVVLLLISRIIIKKLKQKVS
ncbi:MAG: hypothetical protein PHR25_02110 [Clostridia bacterium]|nr:hypothetical protein [Clostridia bacterium]